MFWTKDYFQEGIILYVLRPTAKNIKNELLIFQKKKKNLFSNSRELSVIIVSYNYISILATYNCHIFPKRFLIKRSTFSNNDWSVFDWSIKLFYFITSYLSIPLISLQAEFIGSSCAFFKESIWLDSLKTFLKNDKRLLFDIQWKRFLKMRAGLIKLFNSRVLPPLSKEEIKRN